MINNVSFNGGKVSATKTLARSAAAIEADINENIRIASRILINQNKAASKANKYIPDSAYFGVVPLSPRQIGKTKTLDSISVTKTPLNLETKGALKDEIIPEDSINYLA